MKDGSSEKCIPFPHVVDDTEVRGWIFQGMAPMSNGLKETVAGDGRRQRPEAPSGASEARISLVSLAVPQSLTLRAGAALGRSECRCVPSRKRNPFVRKGLWFSWGEPGPRRRRQRRSALRLCRRRGPCGGRHRCDTRVAWSREPRRADNVEPQAAPRPLTPAPDTRLWVRRERENAQRAAHLADVSARRAKLETLAQTRHAGGGVVGW